MDNKNSIRFILEKSDLYNLDILLSKDYEFILYLDTPDLSEKGQ